MPERTPEQRLALALPEAKPWAGDGLDGMVFDEALDAEEWARAILEADPTIAADMALGAAIRDPANPLLLDAIDEAFYGMPGPTAQSRAEAAAIRAALLRATEGEKP